MVPEIKFSPSHTHLVQKLNSVLVICTRGTLEVTPIFFLPSGNIDTMKFCICAQDNYTNSYKKFWVNLKSFMCLVCMMMNWKETQGLHSEAWRAVHFLTIKNHFTTKMHYHLYSANEEENVMNLRNIQWWQFI